MMCRDAMYKHLLRPVLLGKNPRLCGGALSTLPDFRDTFMALTHFMA